MTIFHPQFSRILPALIFSSVVVTQGQAQGKAAPLTERSRYAAGMSAGITQFDFSGSGTAGTGSIRLEIETRSWLVIEGAVGFFRTPPGIDRTYTYAVPEIQAQVQFPSTVARPYIGVGVGSLLTSGRTGGRRTVSGAAGVRMPIPQTRVDAKAELRLRGIGRSFGSSAADWTLGAGYRF